MDKELTEEARAEIERASEVEVERLKRIISSNVFDLSITDALALGFDAGASWAIIRGAKGEVS